jgi:hypothetical protein
VRAARAGRRDHAPSLLRRFGLRVELGAASGEVFRGTIANAEREAIQKVLTKHPRNCSAPRRSWASAAPRCGAR